MNISRNIFFLAFSFLFIFQSCTENQDCISFPDVKKQFNIKAIRLENEFKKMNSKNEIVHFLDKNKLLSKHFLMRGQYPDSIIINSLFAFVSNSESEKIFNESEEIFGDMQQLEIGFSEMYDLIK